MFRRRMLPQATGLKCLGFGIGFDVKASYNEGGYRTQREGKKEGALIYFRHFFPFLDLCCPIQ